MQRRLFALGLLAQLAPFAAITAQAPGRITGTVTSGEGGQPASGVRINVLGTRSGGESNAEGRYSISIAPGTYRVRASAIGYTPVIMENVPVVSGQAATADFQLKRQTVALERVVVTGYGTQAKRDVTGAVASVPSEQIREIPVTNAIDAIKGRVPGVDITSSGYKPGDAVTVRIRGSRSIKASNDPLYVLDGIPIAGGIGDLTPTDIESIEVLKDASATAIYGSRGANGVILVTTRRGTAGRTRITYDTYAASHSPTNKIAVFDGPAFATYKREAYRAVGAYKCPVGVTQCEAGDIDAFYPEELAALKAGTSVDWQNMIIRKGSQINNHLSVAGGNDRTQYAVSGNLTRQMGIILGQDYDRKTMRVNFETQATNRFRVGGSAQVVRSLQNIGKGDGLYGDAVTNAPLAIPFDSTGALIFKPTADPLRVNLLSDVANHIDERLRTRTFGALFAAYQFAPGIEYRINFGPDLTFARQGVFRGAQTSNRGGSSADAFVDNDKVLDYTIDNLLNVRREIGTDHRVDATLLYSIEKQTSESSNLRASGLPYESQRFYNLGSGSTVEAIGSSISEWSLQSYMARLNYTLRDRYLLTLTTRVDGSSRLAPGRKYATFPSVALGWRVVDDAAHGFGPLNSLKLRTSYGTTGNTSVNPYQTQGSLSRSVYAFGGTGAFGFRPGQLPNENLRWEKTAQMDAGADFGLWGDRLTGTLDLYRATTTDLLMDRQLPPTTGYTQITENIGSTRNSGIELALSAVTIDGWKGVRWTNDFSASVNKNEIVSLTYGKVDDPGNRWFIGQPIDAGSGVNRVYYDYRFLGIWQREDSLEAVKYGRLPGHIRVEDVNGDFKINSADFQILGNSYPKFSGSVNSRIDYRIFDLSAQAITRRGFMIQNTFRTTNSTLAGRYGGIAADYWTPTNPSNTDPRPNKNTESPDFGGTRSYEDGSFARVRHITLGVRLPAALVGQAGAQSIRVYGTAQNPFTFTRSGVLDPEGRTSAGTPSYKAYLVGASVGF